MCAQRRRTIVITLRKASLGERGNSLAGRYRREPSPCRSLAGNFDRGRRLRAEERTGRLLTRFVRRAVVVFRRPLAFSGCQQIVIGVVMAAAALVRGCRMLGVLFHRDGRRGNAVFVRGMGMMGAAADRRVPEHADNRQPSCRRSPHVRRQEKTLASIDL